MTRRLVPLPRSHTDEVRAKFELGRRLRARKRRAEGLIGSELNGTAGKFHIPGRAAVNKGVETKRAKSVKVTLPRLELPE